MTDFVSYAEVVEGLHERFVTIDDFPKYNSAGALVNILAYEPKVIHSTPTLYTLLDSFERVRSGQLTVMKYRILHRLVLQWQDNEPSEAALMPFVHSIPASVDRDPTLGGRITMGLAGISDAATGFVVISSTKYRCIDFFASASTKAPFQSGI